MYVFVAKCSVEPIAAIPRKNCAPFASSSVNSKQQRDSRTVTFNVLVCYAWESQIP